MLTMRVQVCGADSKETLRAYQMLAAILSRAGDATAVLQQQRAAVNHAASVLRNGCYDNPPKMYLSLARNNSNLSILSYSNAHESVSGLVRAFART